MKKLFQVTMQSHSVYVIVLGVAAIGFLFIYSSSAGAADNLSGYAWSENVGWMSFNCANSGTCATSDYGVDVAANGNMSGYAWSENVGWISFNASDTAGCPLAPCAPVLNRALQKLEGWAKAVGADGQGWDGWIHLSGTSTDNSPYGVTISGCAYDNYAWGSDTIGWIHFKGTNYGVTGTGDGCSISGSITAGGSSGTKLLGYGRQDEICWTSSPNAVSCTVSPTGWTGTSSCQTTNPLNEDTTFTVTCTDQYGNTFSDSVFIDVFIPPLTASCSVAPADAKAGQTATWTVSPDGGIGSYSFLWNGAPDPNPLDGQTANPVYVSYNTIGTKTGSVTVTSGDQTMTQACSNSVNVTAGITSFSAATSKIAIGQSTTLSWSSAGFTSCSMNQGIGPVPLSGTRVVTPSATTMYTLSCTDGTTTDSRSVTVTVLLVPEFIEISPSEVVPE